MHPLIFLSVDIILIVFTIGFTEPVSVSRLVGLVFVALCVLQCISGCMLYMVRTPWAALVGGYSITYMYHYLDVALLSRWSFEHRAPVSGLLRPTTEAKRAKKSLGSKKTGSFWDRIVFGLKLTSTFRFVGTEYEISNTPRTKEVSPTTFRRRTLLTILVSYCVLDFINSNNDLSVSTRYLIPEKVPILSRLHQVTAEELIIRTFTVLAAGISLMCVQGGIYHIIALVAVRANLSKPMAWPPFYGSVRDAYSLRRFWELFWHQTNTRKFSSIAHYTTHVLFGFPRGTVMARYIRILVAFLASGVMHVLCDRSAGLSFSDSGAMRFFMTQAFGILLEDCVLRLYAHSPASLWLPRILARSFGFTWVAIFLIWSVPAYMYPMLWRTNQGLQDSTIPFSLFGTGSDVVKALGCFSFLAILAI